MRVCVELGLEPGPGFAPVSVLVLVPVPGDGGLRTFLGRRSGLTESNKGAWLHWPCQEGSSRKSRSIVSMELGGRGLDGEVSERVEKEKVKEVAEDGWICVGRGSSAETRGERGSWQKDETRLPDLRIEERLELMNRIKLLVYILRVFQFILGRAKGAVKRSPVVSTSGLVCEDNPSVAESGYSCSFLARRFGGFLGCEKLLKDLAQDSLPPGIPGSTRVVDACPGSCNKCRECSPGCALWFVGNGVCDPECDNLSCQFDGGDCWRVDCKLSAWSSWSACSVTCGPGGRVTRTRQIIVSPRNGGESCGALKAEETGCNSHIPCPLSCTVSEWGSWSRCSSTCGVGHQMRERSVIKAPKDQNMFQCPETRQIRECIMDTCSSNCTLGEFKFKSAVSGTPCLLEQGCVERREIVLPVFKPELGNYTCNVEERPSDCSGLQLVCPGPCQLSEWSDWSSCSYSKEDSGAEGGYRLLKRRRREARRRMRDARCEDEVEVRACDESERQGVEALVRCNMGEWSSWSSCSTSCGVGSRLRARWLLSEPESGDVLSESLINTEGVCGPLFQTKACNDRSCLTDGCKVSEWSQWSSCSSRVCNSPGLSKRHRSVISLPRRGDCPVLEESRDCLGVCDHSVSVSKSNCMFGDWSAWSTCQDDCYTRHAGGEAGGRSSRQGPRRYRHKMIVFNPKDRDCSAESEYSEVRECQEGCEGGHLVETCQVTEWGPWSSCSANCDGGTRRRIRERVNSARGVGKTGPRPLTRGAPSGCPSLLEVEKCNTHPCEYSCELSPWHSDARRSSVAHDKRGTRGGEAGESGGVGGAGGAGEIAISDCSARCGVGVIGRSRSVIGGGAAIFGQDERGRYASKVCGPLRDTIKCVRVSEECSIDCQVGEWGAWSACSASCGDGFQSRSRELLVPSLGRRCEASTEELRECFEGPCPSSCHVSQWSEWTMCLGGCDERPYKRRERRILEPPAAGLSCPVLEERADAAGECPESERCPSDCEVGEWSSWTECDAKCGVGVEKRLRKVVRRESRGGAPCPNLEDVRPCSRGACRSDCLLGDWEEWGACSKSCGGGSRSRTREVVSQPSEGRECEFLKDFEPCNEFQCIATRDCEVGQWSVWSPCSASCGGGVKRRQREVQVPATGGGRCEFELSQKVGCNGFRCPGEPCIDRPEAQEVVPCSILKAMFGCQKRLIDVAKSNGVPYPEDRPPEARIMDGCPATCGMCTECAPGCQLRDVGNLSCDPACNNAACRFDDGDCEKNSPHKASCVLPKLSEAFLFLSKWEDQGKRGGRSDFLELRDHSGVQGLDVLKTLKDSSDNSLAVLESRSSGSVQARGPETSAGGGGGGGEGGEGGGGGEGKGGEEHDQRVQEGGHCLHSCKESGFIQLIEPKGTPLLYVDGDGIPRIPACEEDECPYLMIQEAPQMIGSVNTLYKRDLKHSYTYIMYRDIGEPIFITGDHQRVILGPVGTLYLISIDSFYPEFGDPSFEKYRLWSLVDVSQQKIIQEFVELRLVCVKNPNSLSSNLGSSGPPPDPKPKRESGGATTQYQRPLRFLSQTSASDSNLDSRVWEDPDSTQRGLLQASPQRGLLQERPFTYVMGKRRFCEDQPEVKEQGILCETLSTMCEMNIPNPQNYGLPENSFVWQVCPATCNRCSECSAGCPEWFRGNTVCDQACNNAACNFDDGDCGGAEDAGSSRKDAGSSRKDAGSSRKDAGSSREDAGSSREDAGSSREEEEGQEEASSDNVVIPEGAITYFAGKFRNCTDIPELIDSLASCKALKQTCQLKLPLSASSLEAGLSHSSTISQVCPKTCGICEECAPGCPKWFIDNGYCDVSCQNPECQFDGKDCSGETAAWKPRMPVGTPRDSRRPSVSSGAGQGQGQGQGPVSSKKTSSRRGCVDSPLVVEVFNRGCEELRTSFGCSIPVEKIPRDGAGLPEGDSLRERPFTMIFNEKRYCEDQPEVAKKGISCKNLSSMCNASIPSAKTGNTVCDRACNNAACNFDDGDCGGAEDAGSSRKDAGSSREDAGSSRKEAGRCRDDPQVEEVSGFSCEQITSIFDCSTLLRDLPGSSIPEDVPRDTLLRHACAESCGLCEAFSSERRRPGGRDREERSGPGSKACKDDVFISYVTGRCRDIMNFSVSLSEVCNEALSERTVLRESKRSSAFSMNKRVYDHCPRSCGRCRGDCEDDSKLQPGECRVAIETASIQGFGCDMPLLQVSFSLAERFGDEKEYLLLSDVCARSCNYCSSAQEGTDGEAVLLDPRSSNSMCSIKSTKHWGSGYLLELRPDAQEETGGSRLMVSCNSGYSSSDRRDTVEAICDLKSSVYMLPETFKCEEPHVDVMRVELEISEASDLDFTAVSSIYTALYSTLPIYQPNGLRIEAIGTTRFEGIAGEGEQSLRCEDQNHQLKAFGINCSMLKPFCSKTLEELAKQFNRSIPDGVSANVKVSLACPVTCDNCQEFLDVVNSLRGEQGEEREAEEETEAEEDSAARESGDEARPEQRREERAGRRGHPSRRGGGSGLGPLYVLFDVGFFQSSSRGRESSFESALKDHKIARRFVTTLKAQFASRGVRLAPKEFEAGSWDSQHAVVSNSKLASEDTAARRMRSRFRRHRMVRILKSDWERFYSGQKGVGMDEEARNLFYTSGISMPLMRSSRFGAKEAVFLKRPLRYLQNSYLRCGGKTVSSASLGSLSSTSQFSYSAKGSRGPSFVETEGSCCGLPQDFRAVLVNEGCGSLIYDRVPDKHQMDLFCRGTSSTKTSCFLRFQQVIDQYRDRRGPLCNTVEFAQQLLLAWCYRRPGEAQAGAESVEAGRRTGEAQAGAGGVEAGSGEDYCFSSIKETIAVGMDSQDFVSAEFGTFRSRCHPEGCFRSHLRYFDAITQLHAAWGYPLPSSPLRRADSGAGSATSSGVRTAAAAAASASASASSSSPGSGAESGDALGSSTGGSSTYSNLEVLLEESNEDWLDLLCTRTSSGAHCQESLSILLERNPIKSKTLLLNPCHSKCFMIVAGRLGASLQRFGQLAADPQSESLGLLLRHYSRHFCVKNSKGQSCGPLLFAGASFALEASLSHKQTAGRDSGAESRAGRRPGQAGPGTRGAGPTENGDPTPGLETHKLDNYCSSGCFSYYVGDGMCDLQCFNEACSWDKGDCLSSSMYPEIYQPLEDLFKGCLAGSSPKPHGPTGTGGGPRQGGTCSSTCRARYSILTETLGCCTSVAVDLYQSLTQLLDVQSQGGESRRLDGPFSSSLSSMWSISRLEQMCGMSLDRTCSDGLPRIQVRMTLALSHPDPGLAEDPQAPLGLSRVVSRSLGILDSDITKVFFTSKTPLPQSGSRDSGFLVDVVIDTGSTELIDLDERLLLQGQIDKLQRRWGLELCHELGDSHGEECSVRLLEVISEPTSSIGISNSTSPALPWMNSVGFSYLNKDLPPEPCSVNHQYLQDASRYKVVPISAQPGPSAAAGQTLSTGLSSLSSHKSMAHGSKLSVSCSGGGYYASAGRSPDTLACNNGRWEAASGLRCTRRCQGLPKLPSGLRLQNNPSLAGAGQESTPTLAHGAVLHVECLSEEYKSTSAITQDSIECLDGAWTTPRLQCTRSCTNLSSTSLGPSSTVVGREYRDRDQRKVFCSDDYYLSPKSGRSTVSSRSRPHHGPKHPHRKSQPGPEDPPALLEELAVSKSYNGISTLDEAIRRGYYILTCKNGTWESEPLICVKGTLTDYSKVRRGIQVTMTHIFSIKTLLACIVIISSVFAIAIGIWLAWVLRYKKLTEMYNADQLERVEGARRVLLELSGIEYMQNQTSLDQTTENSNVLSQNQHPDQTPPPQPPSSSWESLNHLMDDDHNHNSHLHCPTQKHVGR
ncbi:TRAP-C2 extracellular protein [Cryptosporidium canis]|uniref:TRAP-C2 extracellular protein n=1 Tax=Cryptosporidium canis TaxID=195482 RepID=A0ABQ8P6Z9_9CRYT|nr:TRAP-C2 extracellular protein [Cryptosporidium canis]